MVLFRNFVAQAGFASNKPPAAPAFVPTFFGCPA
jgi:hypothetical protein